MNYYKIIKPILFQLPAETAHNMAIFCLKNKLIPFSKKQDYANLKTNIFGLDFPHPLGLAAGFDKNADCIYSLSKQNFSFIEVGTVTPKPQNGNLKPRIFRLKEHEAIINRLGFNNKGIAYFLQNLKNKPQDSIVGANIGKNKDSEHPYDDYVNLINAVYKDANYITINISSPNTANLRDLQNKDELNILLDKVLQAKQENIKKTNINTPILVKIAPDLTDIQCENISDIVKEKNIDGLIISNTTIDKEKYTKKEIHQMGGLSGKPLFKKSTNILKNIYKLTEGKIPIIGVGGISSGSDAYEKIKNGAILVQIYTSFIYNGFEIIDDILSELSLLLEKDGFKNIQEAVGVNLK